MPAAVASRRAGARRTLENALRRRGYARVAGVDAVGRGCLAGPVTAAAVVLEPNRAVAGLRDSKLLTAARRERLYQRIVGAGTWAVAAAEPSDIDRINIHRASLDAMRRAVLALVPPPDFVLVDGFEVPELAVPQERIVGGDRRCAAIAAASIVAKVTRDRMMRRLAAHYPNYGFESNKGYPCPTHKAALQAWGPSAIHRRSWVFMDHMPWTGIPRYVRPDPQGGLFDAG